MNFLKYTFVALLTLLFIGVTGLVVASTGIKSQPGYANLTLPSWSARNTIVAVNVGPIGFKPVQWLVQRIVEHSDKDLEVAERVLLGTIHDVQGLQLRIYNVNDDREVYDQAIKDSTERLKRDAWQTVVGVREDDQRIVVMQYEEAGVISGVTVLASTPDNAIFVNLLGEFDPEEIARYAEDVY
ncbi:MAG: DUF4252 domain-containing protein [Arenicella sp.]|jgi:hypothetical protein|nr:DUF4252 domain-containing protein [Arenicella sp.]